MNLAYLLALTVPVTAVALLYARWEYRKRGKLTISGPYRWSRKPQYLGWFLFLLGFALNDWSLWCLAALFVVAISLHLLVLLEEEHLTRVFGEQYIEYRRKIPRYAGWGRLRI